MLTQQQATEGYWYIPPVPSMLGIPIAMHKVKSPCRAEPRPCNERLAVLLSIDPDSGLAPEGVQLHGWGEVLVARTDRLDLTAEDLVRAVLKMLCMLHLHCTC